MDKKQKIIRIILFAAALITASTAFAIAAVNFAANKTGYKTIAASPDEDAVLYASDFTFKYYFEGRSGEITEQNKQVTAVYSQALARAYKLLDPSVSYNGYCNIADLNRCSGEPLKVGSELYAVLKDAYAKTLDNKGYNMFAGPLYSHVYGILILNDPEEFDPENDPEEKERREKLSTLCGNLSHYRLEFLDDIEHIVSFSVDDEVRNTLAELEEESGIIDLNLLHDAYMAQIAEEALVNAGFINGYITTKSGLTLALSAQKDGEYCLYGIKDNVPAILDTVKLDSAAIASCFKRFEIGSENYYYTLEKDGKNFLRCPFISAYDGYENDSYLSFYTIYEDEAITDAKGFLCADIVFANIKAVFCNEPSNGDGFITAYVADDDPSRVILSK